MIDKKNMKTQCTRLIHAYGTHFWSEKNKTQIDKTQANKTQANKTQTNKAKTNKTKRNTPSVKNYESGAIIILDGGENNQKETLLIFIFTVS